MDALSYAMSREYTWRHIAGADMTRFVELWEQQEGLCAICSNQLVLGNRGVCWDHNHTSGKARGLLCCECNTGIGMLGDKPETLRQAAEYLERYK